MHIERFTDPREFQTRVWPVLLRHEAENNLMLGIVGRLAASETGSQRPDAASPVLGLVEESGEPVAAVMMTPPHRLVLTRCDQRVVTLLADWLRAQEIPVPGVLGPSETAGSFAETWKPTGAGATHVLSMSMRIYQLDSVQRVPGPEGLMEEATLSEADVLLPWSVSFHEAVRESISDVGGALRRRIAQGEIFLWKKRLPLSMAACSGPTPHGIRINHVYTPPEYRGRGYATALVASLSQRMLDTGRRFCFLFTDLSNPTSNSIYQKIGYRPVCDVDAYDFQQ